MSEYSYCGKLSASWCPAVVSWFIHLRNYILIYMPCFYLYLFAWSLSLILIFSLPSSHAVVSSVEVPESQHETSSWCDAPKRNGWESASWQSGVRNFLLSSRKSHNDLVHFPLRRMLVFWKTQSIWNIGAKIRSHQKLLVAVTFFLVFECSHWVTRFTD